MYTPWMDKDLAALSPEERQQASEELQSLIVCGQQQLRESLQPAQLITAGLANLQSMMSSIEQSATLAHAAGLMQ